MVRPGGGAFQKALSPAPPGFSLSGPGEPFLQKTTGVFYIAPIETCAKLREYQKGVIDGRKETMDG